MSGAVVLLPSARLGPFKAAQGKIRHVEDVTPIIIVAQCCSYRLGREEGGQCGAGRFFLSLQ